LVVAVCRTPRRPEPVTHATGARGILSLPGLLATEYAVPVPGAVAKLTGVGRP
jgi:hypothetical protein